MQTIITNKINIEQKRKLQTNFTRGPIYKENLQQFLS